MNFTFVLPLQENPYKKAHTTFQPLVKSDVLETSRELLHRGVLTQDLVVVVVTRSAHLAVPCMQRRP